MGIPHKSDVADKVDQLTAKPEEATTFFNKLSRNPEFDSSLPEMKSNCCFMSLSKSQSILKGKIYFK